MTTQTTFSKTYHLKAVTEALKQLSKKTTEGEKLAIIETMLLGIAEFLTTPPNTNRDALEADYCYQASRVLGYIREEEGRV